jgi:hypothetical protein
MNKMQNLMKITIGFLIIPFCLGLKAKKGTEDLNTTDVYELGIPRIA